MQSVMVGRSCKQVIQPAAIQTLRLIGRIRFRWPRATPIRIGETMHVPTISMIPHLLNRPLVKNLNRVNELKNYQEYEYL